MRRWWWSWRREDLVLALFLVGIAAAVVGLAGVALDAVGHV